MTDWPGGGHLVLWWPAVWYLGVAVVERERRGLNNKSECCQYTSYNKLCYTHNHHHHHQQSTCYCGGGEGVGGTCWEGREGIQLWDVLEKFDNHSNYLTWGWHWSSDRPFYSCIIPLRPGGGGLGIFHIFHWGPGDSLTVWQGHQVYVELSISQDVLHFLPPCPSQAGLHWQF